MLVTGNELDLVSVIGIILRIGIVKKSAIMMVDFALELSDTKDSVPKNRFTRRASLGSGRS